ncbi:disabled homolog 2-like [Pungitius pungitius]|uniref:disabled homolog 2-like n=1 Tax=Pungitius pungitius TaxID=134920 RepID=UPI0018876B21|nr:disabled homolog 2-like [Pungitius pungitius]
METEQAAASCRAPGQTSVRTWLSSSRRGTTRTPSDVTSRFHGDGVRYKAKLIGVDPLPCAPGEKMCWDSMMKLKGFEAAARRQGKHKQRVWLKVSENGLKMVDERTGAVLHEHHRSRISSLKTDESDPRALAYVYQHHDTCSLFYIKTANRAEPVLVDIEEVCQIVDQKSAEEPAEATTQIDSLLLQSDTLVPPAEGPAPDDVFSAQPGSSSGQSTQASFSNELMEVFSLQTEEPLMPNKSSCTSQPESPQPMLSSSQILSMFPAQPAGGSPYCSPPYSPSSLPWGQQGFLGNQWAAPAVAPWAPAGVTVPPAGGQMMMGGGTSVLPTAVNGYLGPLNSPCSPDGATGPALSVSPTGNPNPL